MSRSPAHRGLRVSLALVVAVVSAVTLFASGNRLLSALYVTYSYELQKAGRPARAYAAGVHAQRRAQWNPEGYRTQLRSGLMRPDLLLPVSSAALRWSPADASVWAERSRVLAESNLFGNALADTLRAMQTLAPTSPPLHVFNIGVGLRYWHRGNPQVRGYWLTSMRFMLNAAPKKFARWLTTTGNAERFCWTVATDLGADDWCKTQLQE